MRNLFWNGLGLTLVAAAVYGIMDGQIALAIGFAIAATTTAVFLEIKHI